MTNDLLTPEQCFERDIRLYGVQAAREMERLRRKYNLGLSVLPLDDKRNPKTLETVKRTKTAADKPLTKNLKDWQSFL